MNTIAQRIKERREALGISQADLAYKCGYTSRTSIAKIESGTVDLPQSKIVALADALYVSPAYLMGIEDTAPDPEDSETMRIAEELRNRPGMRLLFDAAKKCNEDDLRSVAAFISNFRKEDDD